MPTFKFITDTPVQGTEDLRREAAGLSEDFIVINTRPYPCDFGYLALERFAEVAEYTGADMLYSDHYELIEKEDGTT